MLLLLLAANAAMPFHLRENGRDIDFRYAWPAEAAAIPSLQARLRADLRKDRAQSAAAARSDRAAAAKARYPFHRHEFARKLRFGGQSTRLASFADERSGYTGGAHPSSATRALLWDRARGAVVSFANLFRQAPSSLLRPAYCKALTAERRKKTGSPRPGGTPWEACPDPQKLTIIPEDKNRNGRFDRINVTASPYDVGSYAEGYYIVMLPVTAALVKALRPQFRSSFEPQRQ